MWFGLQAGPWSGGELLCSNFQGKQFDSKKLIIYCANGNTRKFFVLIPEILPCIVHGPESSSVNIILDYPVVGRPDQQEVLIWRHPKFIKRQFPSGVAVQGCEIDCVHVLLEFVVPNEQRFLVWVQSDIKMVPMAF